MSVVDEPMAGPPPPPACPGCDHPLHAEPCMCGCAVLDVDPDPSATVQIELAVDGVPGDWLAVHEICDHAAKPLVRFEHSVTRDRDTNKVTRHQARLVLRCAVCDCELKPASPEIRDDGRSLVFDLIGDSFS